MSQKFRLLLFCSGVFLLSCESMFEKGVGLVVASDSDAKRVLFSQTIKIYSPVGMTQATHIKEDIVSVFGHIITAPNGVTHLAEAAIDVEFQQTAPSPSKLVVLRGIKSVRDDRVSLKKCIWYDPYSCDAGSLFDAHAIRAIKQRDLNSYSLTDWRLDQKERN